MKKLISTTLVLLFVVMADLAQAVPLNLAKAEEFEFVHCKVATSHYVFDLRKEPHAMYMESAANDKKASELKNLLLKDDQLDSNTIPGADVSWISKKMGLTFKLVILDNGGYSMSGTVNDGTSESAVSCSEVTIEK